MFPTTFARRALVRVFVLVALVYPASLVTTLELASPPTAEARSGGSGGGFSYSGGGSSGGGYSGGGGYSSGGGGYSGGGGGIPLPPEVALAIVAIFIVVFIVSAIKQGIEQRAKAARERMTVGRVQLAFNALKTAGLRDRIEHAVRTGDLSTSTGIYRLGQAVCLSLAPMLHHVSHAGFLEVNNLEPNEGEGEFNRHTRKARSFYDREIVRRDAKGLTQTTRNSAKANELTDEDGDFGINEFFVVTLVMCVNQGTLGLPRKVGGSEDVTAAVSTLLSVPSWRHIGFEVIWTPAAESDILTRDELLIDFPELAPL